MKRYICEHCKSTDVRTIKTTTKRWDMDRQYWSSESVEDKEWCNQCDNETALIRDPPLPTKRGK